jgi:hypothetical protein
MDLNYGHVLDPISADRLVKREVAQKTKTERLMDGKATAVFSLNVF